MDNWALVVGVNEYKTAEHALRGAVNDAVAVARWLLEAGGVKPRQLYLHLSGKPDEAPPVQPRPADRGSIIDGMEELLARSGGEGTRFYFYFAGHGLSSSVNAQLQSAVLPSDFRAAETDRSFTVASLFSLMAGTAFAEQYFFIDACRNLPFDTDAVLGRYPNPKPPRTPPSPQFVMYATQPGVKAIEIRQPNDEHGAFTKTLLAGLRGAGSAKAWDDDAGNYSVRWDSLFRYVEGQVRARQLAAGANADGPLVQVPQQYGERGTQNPLLASLDETKVARQRLAIRVAPNEALPLAKLRVTDLFGLVEEFEPPLAELVPVELMPRTYGLRAVASGYRSQQGGTRVDLYEDRAVDLTLAPETSTSPAGGAALSTRGSDPTHLVFHVANEMGGLSRNPNEGTLCIQALDRLAWLELATAAGKPLGSGTQSLSVAGLKPQFYRASLLAPDGRRTEQVVEVVAGQTTLVELLPPPETPSAALAQALADGGIRHDGGVIEPSEAVGSAYFLKLSTLLALAVGAETEIDKTSGVKLRRLGIPSFNAATAASLEAPSEADGGAYLVVGDDSDDPTLPGGSLWRGARMICAPSGASPLDESWSTPLDLLPRNPGIAFAARRLRAGPHGMRLQLQSGITITMPITVMSGWMALLVVTREANQAFELHHYQLPLRHIPAMAGRRFEPTAFAALRRVEMMQRMVQAGRLTPTLPDVESLLYDKWRDPIAGCLGGYLRAVTGGSKAVRIPAGNLVNFFPGLPDSHVLMALAHESEGRLDEARQWCRSALQRGLPVFREGLLALVAAGGRLQLRDELGLAEAWLARVPEGSLFCVAFDTSQVGAT